MRLHLVGFPHTRFDSSNFSHCAYTTKAIRWVKMMGNAGHHVTVYWGGDKPVNTDGVADYVSLLSNEEQERLIHPDLPGEVINVRWGMEYQEWQVFNYRLMGELISRWRKPDLVATSSGITHDSVFIGLTHIPFVEPFVGYHGISMHSIGKAFESSAWMHDIYGNYNIDDGPPRDTVIYNWHDSTEFEEGENKNYLLYIGRKVQRKGIRLLPDMVRGLGLPLMLAGQGGHLEGSVLVTAEGDRIDFGDTPVTDLGVLQPEQRKRVYAQAAATLVPTRYIGPWEGVAAEAMMSGVHPVTSNWGAFREYVPEQTRFNFDFEAQDTIRWAVENRGFMPDGQPLREYAEQTFGMEVSTKRMDKWLHNLVRERYGV